MTKKNKEVEKLTTHLTNQIVSIVPVQDNVTRRKDEAARKIHADRSVQGLNNPVEQSRESSPSNDQKTSGNDRTWPNLRERS